MKKAIVFLLLSVLMRDGTGAGVVSPLRAARQGGNNSDVASATAVDVTQNTDARSATASDDKGLKSAVDVARASETSNDGKAGSTGLSDPARASANSNDNADAAKADAGEGDIRAQWTASLLARNPFIPFGTPKASEKEEKKGDDDWASKKADELNLQSVTEYPTYTEFSIEVISTKRRCWIRSDCTSDKVPFVYVNHRTDGEGDKQKKVLTVKNTVTGDVMEIRQQERKANTSRGSSYGGYDDYGSSYYDDDFLFSNFD